MAWFGFQKNEALRYAKFKWVLSIDADEIITSKLKKEIILIAGSDNTAEAYSIPRQSFYCGNLIKFSGVPLPGGAMLNAAAILNEAVSELREIELTLLKTQELPVDPMIG